ncbi:10178_t:CDS:1, partial [Acaulospora colombiana]
LSKRREAMNNLQGSNVTSGDYGPFEDVKSVDQQRWILQEEIKSLQKLADTEERNVTLFAKRLDYNKAVDALYVPQPRVDPMDILPHEIWHNILVELSSIDPLALKDVHALCTLQPTEPLIPLTKVSRRWRNFLLSEPALWRVVSLWFDDHTTINTIPWQLGLSGNLPLTIILAPQANEQWPRLQAELLKHRKRIESILLTTQYYWYMENSKLHYVTMPQSLLPLPNLRHLGNPLKDFVLMDALPEFLALCPSVERISNIPITVQVIQKMAERLVLDEIMISDGFSTVYPLLLEIPNIKKISFQAQEENSEDPRASESVLEATGFRNLQWTSLTYDALLCPFPVSLLYCLPFLTVLDIATNIEVIKKLVEVLHKLPCLFTFKSIVLVPGANILRPPEIILPSYSVRSLELQIQYTFKDRWLQPETARMIHPSHRTGIIGRMFLHAMPATEPIKLSIHIPTPSLSHALEGWSKVQTLELVCFGATLEAYTPPRDVPTTVKQLSLGGIPKMPFLIFSSSAEILRCRTDDLGPSDAPHMPLISLTQWSALQTLDVYGDIFNWKDSSALRLKTITLRNRSLFGDLDNGITSFVHALACRPDCYPLLEEIVLWVCPEWDILMIMLERRNLLAGPLIKPIKRITLPSIYSPNI